VTSPEPLRNREFGRVLARALHRPSIFLTPAFALWLMFGQMADEALLVSERALPRRAMDEGFRFERNTLAESLARQIR